MEVDPLRFVCTPDLIYLERCNVCDKPASKKCSGCCLAFYCSSHHQRSDWLRHRADCRPYEIQNVDGTGLCLVALKCITADTIIISEYPVLIFENSNGKGKDLENILHLSNSYLHKCPGCDSGKLSENNPLKKVHACGKCGMPLCGIACENSKSHLHDCDAIQEMKTKIPLPLTLIPEILRDIMLMRIIVKETQKGKQISYKSSKWGQLLKLTMTNKLSSNTSIVPTTTTRAMTLSKQFISSLNLPRSFPLSLAAIGKTNMESVPLLNWTLKHFSIDLSGNRQALYEKYSFLSHSCAPNAEWWIDDNRFYHKLFVRVIKPIVPGERITINCSDQVLLCNPTLERRQILLKELSINCECERCIDPIENGICISGVRCTICKDSLSLSCNYYFPTNPLEKTSTWTCSGKNCKAIKTHEQISTIVKKAEKELGNITGEKAELVITKLQDFIVKYQRKVLHPYHFLILMGKSRINKVVSCFLGSGEKTFLCVIAALPRAYDYCSYKLEFLMAYLDFLIKLYEGNSDRIIGEVKYEMGFCEAALLFQDFYQERMNGSSFFRRLHAVLETLNKCRECLLHYPDCLEMTESAKKFSQMLRRLFGSDFLSSYRWKLVESCEPMMKKSVDDAISKWKKLCEDVDLLRIYIGPQENNKNVTNEDLQAVIQNIPDSKL